MSKPLTIQKSLKADEPEKPLGFQFKSVKKKPSRRYKKGSKYDPLIESFLKCTDNLVEVSIPGREGTYIRGQLLKRIDAKELKEKIKVSVVNNVLYLEKTPEKTPEKV